MAEHDDETTGIDGDELLRQAAALRDGPSTALPTSVPERVAAWPAARSGASGEARLREADRPRSGPPLADPVDRGAVGGWRTTTDTASPALRDPGALLVGLWFVLAGVLAAVLGDSALDDLPPVLIPISFAVVGLGLLLPKRGS